MRPLTPLRAVALLALAACDPAPTQDAQGPRVDASELSCSAFAEMSEAALRTAYGEDNIVEQTLPGPEGESYTATVLYADDPSRRLEIVWRDRATRMQPASVTVSGERSVWTGPNGLSLGDSLARVEELNGRPFKLWGFGWDYGGWVSDWDEGAFATRANCLTRVRFEETEISNAAGDVEFRSDVQQVRDFAPRVVEFGLVFQSGQ